MKRHYILAFTVCACSYLLSMEIELVKRDSKQTSKASKANIFEDNPYSLPTATIVTAQTINRLNSDSNYNYQPPCCTANQKGWEKEHEIMFAPYTSNSVEEHQRLLPRYTSEDEWRKKKLTNTLTTQKKLLLGSTIPVKLTPHLMEKLYKDAKGLFLNDSSILTFFDFVCAMNNAKMQGINEDSMGKFAYDSITSNPSAREVLFFSCFKKYTEKIKINGELLPSRNALETKIEVDKALFQALELTYKDEVDFNEKHSAFFDLYHASCALSKLDPFRVYWFIHYLYGGQDELFNCPTGSYSDLKNDFFHKAYDLFNRTNVLMNEISMKERYDLVKMIEKALESDDIKNVKDFGGDLIAFQPNKTIIQGISNWFNNEKDIFIEKRSHIVILCILIENYNKARGGKETPTPRQILSYCYVTRNIDLSFPDTFDKRLFDNNCYAIEEFEKFVINVDKLAKLNKQSAQYCVRKVYPHKK